MKVLVILLFVSMVFVNSKKCPNDSVNSIFDKSTCFYYGTQKRAYFHAEEECRNRNGHLIKTKNQMEDIYISQQAVTHFTNSLTSDFWFGLNKMENNEWSWIDGTKMEYSNWSENEPHNHTDNICGAIAFAGARWSAQDCYKVKPFVCAFQMNLKK